MLSYSSRIGIIFTDPDLHPGSADPDLDPNLFQPNIKLNYLYSLKLLFPENFNPLSKILKILTPMTLTRKIEQPVWTGNTVKN
jgi:hypothetical protein